MNQDEASWVKEKAAQLKDLSGRLPSYWNVMQLLLLICVTIVVVFFGITFTPLAMNQHSTSLALWAMWPLETVLFSYHSFYWKEGQILIGNEKFEHKISLYSDWRNFFDNNDDNNDEMKKTFLSAMPAAKLSMQCYKKVDTRFPLQNANKSYIQKRYELDAFHVNSASVCSCVEIIMKEVYDPVLDYSQWSGIQNIAVTNIEVDDMFDILNSNNDENLTKICKDYKVDDKTGFKKCYNKISVDIVDYCQKVSMPHVVKSYNGFVNMPISWIFAQIFIILSMLQHVLRDNLPKAEQNCNNKTKTVHSWLLGVFTLLVVLAVITFAFLFYFHALPSHEYDEDMYKKLHLSATDTTPKNSLIGLDSTNPEHTSYQDTDVSIMIYVIVFLAVYLLVEVLFLFYDFSSFQPSWFKDIFGQTELDAKAQQAIVDVNKCMFWQQVRTDLPFIIGVTMLFAVYQLQAGMQNVNSLVCIILVSFVLGFLHHICNLLRSVWNILSQIFLFEGETVNATDNWSEKDVINMQKILHFLFWTRVYIFCLIGVCAYFYVFNVDSTALQNNTATTYFSSLIPYVALFLLACIILPDIAWEVAPRAFKNMQDQWRKRTFLLCIFILYLNFKQFVWAHINIDNFEKTYLDDL